MLRITVSTSRARAKSYFSTADYYREGQELVGLWRGRGAAMLGLASIIQRAEWDALCDNLRPDNGKPLTVRRRAERRVGWDFNFNAPKGLSLLYGLTRDERLQEAFRDSVRETMDEMERLTQARVRKAGVQEDRATGNLVWGEYVHRTSRPVDGVPDPSLHAHCFVFNATYDREERRWKAAQIGAIKRDAPYYQAVFHAKLARRVEELGLATHRITSGWDLAALDKVTLEKFSRRTAQIEARARELGITDVEAKAELGAKTRERKAKDLSMTQLAALWRSRMTSEELATTEGLEAAIGGKPRPERPVETEAAVTRAVEHVFERRSTAPTTVLMGEALRQGVGSASREAIEREVKARELIHGDHEGREFVTTRVVLGEEQAMLDLARGGRGACSPIDPERTAFTREWLNEDQRQAVRHVLGSNDRVVLVRGAAGAGKTTMMQEAREAIEAAGYKAYAFAPSSGASRDVLRNEAGFAQADTVATLLKNRALQGEIAGHPSVVFIDEAGLVGTKTMCRLFELAQELGTRLVLVGDVKQHASVERGDALRLLEDGAGLRSAELKEIQRQKGAYKAAMKALSEGRTEEGFAALDRLGWIREVDRDQQELAITRAYLASVRQGRSTLVVSPTHAEGDRIIEAIRGALKAEGRIGQDERTLVQLMPTQWTLGQKMDPLSYQPGDVVVYHQNAPGHTKGESSIVYPDPTTGTLRPPPPQLAERFTVYRTGTIRLAPGDRLRVTRNGKTKEGKHVLNNGDLFTLKGFTRGGDLLVFKSGVGVDATERQPWTIDSGYGHLTHGLVVTSHASQGKTVDCVLIGQSSASFAASGREQFYVSASRGRHEVRVFTDSKAELLEAVRRSHERLSATELVAARERSMSHNQLRRRIVREQYEQQHEQATSARRHEARDRATSRERAASPAQLARHERKEVTLER